MIAISQRHIRAVRRPGSEDEKTATLLEQLLSTSPQKQPARGESNFESDPASDPSNKGGAAKSPQQEAKGAPATAVPAPVPAAEKTTTAAAKTTAAATTTTASPADEKAAAFVKVEVDFKVPTSSSLSKGLDSLKATRQLVGPVTTMAGPNLNLQVFFQSGKAVMKMKVQGTTTVEEVIDLIIRQHADEKRKPPLLPDSDAYDLRVVDEDDGEVDTDIPPLDRTGDIHKMGVHAVALCERQDPVAKNQPSVVTQTTASSPQFRKKRGVSIQLNLQAQAMKTGRVFVKIHMPNQVTHVIPIAHDQPLEALLPLIAKKRSTSEEDYQSQHYKFVYVDDEDEEALEMKMPVGQLQSEELMLVRRVNNGLKSIPEFDDGQPITMTKELASTYIEYKVIKTNQRGKKQERIMGIDGEKIYNKQVDGKSDVQRAFRLISDVISIDMLPDRKSFRIVFQEKGTTEVREYEAESKEACAQIIAKVKFLMPNHQE